MLYKVTDLVFNFDKLRDVRVLCLFRRFFLLLFDLNPIIFFSQIYETIHSEMIQITESTRSLLNFIDVFGNMFYKLDF